MKELDKSHLKRKPYSNITPDNAAAQMHLQVLSGKPDIDSTRFIFCGFHDADKDRRPWQRCCTLSQAWPEIVQLQSQGYGIFVAVNGSDNGRRKKADITEARACWLDLDQPMNGSFCLQPSLLVITSPHKGHAYWPISADDQFEDLAELEAINRVIAVTHGGDINATDRSRVLRLAGSFHLKAEPFLVRIHAATATRYGRQEIVQAYPMPVLPKPKPRPILKRIERANRYIQAAINGEREQLARAVEGTRNPTLNQSAFALGQLGLSVSEIGTLLGPTALGIGLERGEAWRTIQSGAEAGAANPREIGGRAR